MCHVSRVTCHVSHVMCHLLPVICHFFYNKKIHIYIFFLNDKVVELVVQSLLSTGPTPSSFFPRSIDSVKVNGRALTI